MSTIGCCLDRLIDPLTKRAVAAYGWIQVKPEFPKKFWVSIENKDIEFFAKENSAKVFYDSSIAPLLESLQVKNTERHNPIECRPTVNRHNRA